MSKREMLSVYSELMLEWNHEKNTGIFPCNISAGSNYRAWWICAKGHSWQAKVNIRTAGKGCPYCTNRVVLIGYNDLLTKSKSLSSEWNYCKNGSLRPENITAGTNKKVWWICDDGHEWEARVSSRMAGRGCPYCAGLLPIIGETDLVTVYPHLIKEWDGSKNGALKPNKVYCRSTKKVWWKCKKGHSWNATVASRRITNCPTCAGKVLLKGFNDLATVNVALTEHWDYEKNKLTPSEITCCSQEKVWWKCDRNHSWQASVARRNNGTGCPHCSGRKTGARVCGKKRLSQTLLDEWDYEKNYPHEADTMYAFSAYKAWWLCKSGHSWQAYIGNRSNGNGCPYCSGRLLINGVNDLQTVRPDLAGEWDFIKNAKKPDEVLPCSREYAWWKCKKGHSWKAVIKVRNIQGAGCPYCAGRVQYQTKIT